MIEMKKYTILLFFLVFSDVSFAQKETVKNDGTLVTLKEGKIRGSVLSSGVLSFKGIPYAEPPVGERRWRSPIPKKKWNGIKNAIAFGSRSPQRNTYDDMVFRSAEESEDCLYLNIWKPQVVDVNPLPVVVYIHGGGFSSGDGSEPRYDGESMAGKGVIFITINYRLSIFGFLAHSDLSRESKSGSSGNYGLQDQNEALRWVKRNISAFGGNPDQITIAGESAGSMSVSAQMCSPLSKGLFNGAIGQSGSVLGFEPPVNLANAEKIGAEFAKACGANSIDELRKIPTETILRRSKDYWFPLTVDGYFFVEQPLMTYTYGRQMDVPLLAGWNTAERSMNTILFNQKPTVENYKGGVDRVFTSKSKEIFALYPANADEQVAQLATDLASDRFISYSTWKWIDVHSKTNGHPVYRYLFSRKRPAFIGRGSHNADIMGAVHASDIEYALGNLNLNKSYQWENEDVETSKIFQSYLVNFIRSGNPNGEGLPKWFGLQSSIPKVMIIDGQSKSEPEKNGKRYMQLDRIVNPLIER
ncbi:carboxylesterase/lipase family protein [Pedobacter agri]|uniref:carboxylesterase/lipase family protein n=1 Tax=Pedobacter agri TaxID=454586 RepID=UPI0027863F5E|nr:carboxylesterase family protein [Pedobacter agri]MDQ1142730.1 para-nitrobenzyl esterase [Pedobacter agri]